MTYTQSEVNKGHTGYFAFFFFFLTEEEKLIEEQCQTHLVRNLLLK